LRSLATARSKEPSRLVNVDGNQAGDVLVAIDMRCSCPESGSSYVCTVELAPASRISAKFLSLSSLRDELGTGLELLT
jgi:hypothetical protein